MAQLPKLDLALNEAVRLKLMRDKCYEGTNGYGPFYLYTVQHEGEEKSFFATQEIHEQIVKHGLKSGSEFILRKTATQNGKRINASISFELVQNIVPATKPSNGNGHVATDTLKDIMLQSLEEAVEITRSITSVPFQNEDIQKIASCLFIARTRMN